MRRTRRPETWLEAEPGSQEQEALVAAARNGDESAFAVLVDRHRRELHVHCYRMLGSFTDAEDMLQETFLRAWRHRDKVNRSSGFRAWLYGIATNACLDDLRQQKRGAPPPDSTVDVSWLQPYPDRLLDEIAAIDTEPEAVAIARDTISLAFLATIQLLPPRQRAVLILRDVLGWSAVESAALLQSTVAGANSALQRARTTLQERMPVRRHEWSASVPSAQERRLLGHYMDAMQRADTASLAALVAEDVRITMPPEAVCHVGRKALAPLFALAFDPVASGDWRLTATSANRQPAAGNYLRRPGDTEYHAFKLDVLHVEAGVIVEITTFDARMFPKFALAPTRQ